MSNTPNPHPRYHAIYPCKDCLFIVEGECTIDPMKPVFDSVREKVVFVYPPVLWPCSRGVLRQTGEKFMDRLKTDIISKTD